MKKRIICLVLSLAAVAGLLGANGTYAWFVTTSGAGSDASSLHNFSSGNIGVSIVGSLKTLSDGEKLQPEQELLAVLSDDLKAVVGADSSTDNKLYIKSTSLVNTDVRIKISYTYFETTVDETTGKETTSLASVSYRGEGTEFVAETADGWTFSEEDGCFYYDSSLPAVTVGTAAYIPVFTSLRYSGENSDFPANLYDEETEFKVTVAFEAKQADYAEWTDIGSFETVAD